MLCMICKNNVPDEAVICPTCSAMPWKIPDSFLNPEQHQIWLDTVYEPQKKRWEKLRQLQERNAFLSKELHNELDTAFSLKESHERLSAENRSLQEEIQALRAGTGEAVSKDDFHILNGTVLWKYNGRASVVHIPDGVIMISDYAFCKNNVHKMILPESVERISHAAFYKCRYLESINIPKHVVSIDNKAFMYCVSLKQIDIPEGVTYIGSGAFYNCKSLTSVTLPGSVTALGEEPFGNCDNLKTVRIPSTLRVVMKNWFPRDCKIIYD